MAFNGSGTYSLPGAALNTGDTVSATENNTLRNDMATAFNKTMCRDGQSAATANLPMGGFKLTGLAAGSTAGDSVRYEQLPSGTNVLAEGSGGTGTTVGHNGFKNRIINGAMMIDQRNSGAAVTPSGIGNNYTLDRWYLFATQASKFTVQQVAAPSGFVGFTQAAKITVASAFTPGASDVFAFNQAIEGVNVADFGWGTANAQPVPVSFWAQSSVAGTYTVTILNASGNRSYIASYTLAANTATKVNLLIPGDTSGTWGTGNGVGLYLINNMGSGSSSVNTAGSWLSGNYNTVSGGVQLVANAGATFYITGVQLEKGSTATSFDYRPYGTELALCQRYLPTVQANPAGSYQAFAMGMCYATTSAMITVPFKVSPRVPPNGVVVSAASDFSCWTATTSGTSPSGISFNSATYEAAAISLTGMSGLVAGNATTMISNNTANAKLQFTGCEL